MSFEPAKPLLLLTNDDGLTSPGLRAVAEAVDDLGDLLIVAPCTQQTGMGRAVPLLTDGALTRERITVNGRSRTAYALCSSPAQAVMYGSLVLAPRLPDLVISGVNYGENVATSVTASGTVGAALEAASTGIKALAVSLETPQEYHYNHGGDVHWDTAAHFARRFAELMLGRQLPPDVDVLNINVPSTATPATDWRITRQSRQAYYENFLTGEAVQDQLAPLGYRISVFWEKLEPGSDVEVFARDRLVSVTPLSIDLTSRTDLGKLEEMLRHQWGNE